MRSIPKTLSIQQVGLRKHLDGNAAQHNNYGYDDFVKMVNADLDKANLAKAFNVSRRTIYVWLGVFNKEQQFKEEREL